MIHWDSTAVLKWFSEDNKQQIKRVTKFIDLKGVEEKIAWRFENLGFSPADRIFN